MTPEDSRVANEINTFLWIKTKSFLELTKISNYIVSAQPTML